MNSQRHGERRLKSDSPGPAVLGESTVKAGYTPAIQANVAIYFIKDVQNDYPALELLVLKLK